MQCFYYDRHWSFARCVACLTIVAVVMGRIQASLIFSLHISKSRGVDWPVTCMAILGVVLLDAGVLRHYLDIYQHHSVRGISFIFVSIDYLGGDLCSLLSVFFEPEPSILSIAIYGTELFLWLGVYTCGIYFNLVPYVRQRFSSRAHNESTTLSRLPQTCNIDDDTEVSALHTLSSSTSVFHTPSSLVIRPSPN